MGAISQFPSVHVQHSFSDHCPISVKIGSARRKMGGRVTLVFLVFHFDSDWILKGSFENHLKGWWPLNVKTLLSHKLGDLGEELKGWAMHVENDSLRRKMDWSSSLDLLNHEDKCEEILAEIIDVKLALNLEEDMKELF